MVYYHAGKRYKNKRSYLDSKKAIHASYTHGYTRKYRGKQRRVKQSVRPIRRSYLPTPANGRKHADGSITLQYDEGLKGDYRASFGKVTDSDRGREFAASYDFENPTKPEKIKNIDITRGYTDAESPGNRAYVKPRIEPDDVIEVHNHPNDGGTSYNWNRPSGSDIGNTIYLQTTTGFHVKDSYIAQPDGRWIRYNVIDPEKARNAYRKAQREFNDAPADKKGKHTNGPDWVIENWVKEERYTQRQLGLNPQKYETPEYKQAMSLYLANYMLKKERLDKEYKEALAQKDKKQYRLLDQSLKLQQELNQKEKELKAKYPGPQNKYFIKQRPNESDIDYQLRQRNLIARREFLAFKKYLKEDWGVELKRMPKNYYQEF